MLRSASFKQKENGEFPTTNNPTFFTGCPPWERARHVINACMQSSSKLADQQCEMEFGAAGNGYFHPINRPLGRRILLDDTREALDTLPAPAVEDAEKWSPQIRAWSER